jgi:four helix bundle protein
MTIRSFEDVIAWQQAKELTVLVYASFRQNKDFSFRDQIQRASVSIMNNIAEGFERRSNKELKQFLFVAKGSCGEVRSMVRLAYELKYLTFDQSKAFVEKSAEISKVLSGFIKKL